MSTTPNMSLVLPDASSTVGPTYAELLTNVGGAFYLIDSHNHAPGYGLQVPTAGININANLSAGGYAVTALYATAYNDLGTTSSLNRSVYFNGRDLYVKDGNGTAIQMTASGSIAGATGSISGLSSPATASYSSITKTFTWNQDSNYRAHMDFASAVLHRGAAASENGITLIPPAGLSASYTMTLPSALPGAALYALTIDNTGACAFSSLADGTTLENTASVIRIKDGGVSSAKIATGVVTGTASATATTANGGNIAVGTIGPANMVALGQATASFNQTGLTSSTLADVTGASVSLTTTGRPICVVIQGAAADTVNGIQVTNSSGTGATGHVAVLVDGANAGQFAITNALSAGAQYHGAGRTCIATGISSGAHTIKVQYKVSGGGGTASMGFVNCVLVAFEL